jgi:hypothetical protein
MVVKYLLSGFIVKIIAGFDDTMTRIPIVANITRTKRGRYAFAIGVLLAVTLAVILSFLFGSTIKAIPYSNYIAAGLIFLIALSIYFDWFIERPKEKVEKELRKIKRISLKRFLKLIVIGFLTAIATIIDDIIVYSGLFLGPSSNAPYIITGIFAATFLQIGAMIYFSKKIMDIKYKKEITVVGLIILAGLIAGRIL